CARRSAATAATTSVAITAGTSCSASTNGSSRESGTRGKPRAARLVAARIVRASGKCAGVEAVVDREVRHVGMPYLVERTDHLLTAGRRRLEQEFGGFGAIDHPRMLPVAIRLGAADHAADIELSLHPDLGQLAPRPQREILAVATPQLFEDRRVLPEI